MSPADPTQSVASRRAREWHRRTAGDFAQFLAAAGALTAAELLAVCCLDLRCRVERGQDARAEEYLRYLGGEAADPEAILDLVYTEYLARRGRQPHRDPPPLAARFPLLADRIQRLLALDGLLDPDATRPPPELPPTTTLRPPSGDPAAYGGHPARIGRYPILRLLDRGGQGVLFQGIHPSLQIPVVVKWVPEAGSWEREALISEGRALASVEHPHLCRVYDLDFDQGRPFLVMEYLPGVNLHARVREAPVAPDRAACWVAKVARALDAVHQKGLIHRDVKPKNVMIGPDGEPKLIDFGLARFRSPWSEPASVQPGAISGSLPFMPPEQAHGRDEEISPRSDLFSLGATLFFLLTGEVPIPGSTPAAILENARRGNWDESRLESPAIPRRLADLCRRCLQARPEARPESAAAVAAELERFTRTRSRRLFTVVSGGLVVLALAVGAIAALGGRLTPPPAGRSPAIPEPISLSVSVWVRDRYIPLPDPAPVRSGGRIRMEATLPEGRAARMLTRTSAGKWTRLAARDLATPSERFNFPAEVGKGVLLDGNGNETVLLLVGGADSLSRVERELIELPAESWPLLPATSVISLQGRSARVLQKSRDLGRLEDEPNPEGEVRELLERLGQRVEDRGVRVCGVVFRSIR